MLLFLLVKLFYNFASANFSFVNICLWHNHRRHRKEQIAVNRRCFSGKGNSNSDSSNRGFKWHFSGHVWACKSHAISRENKSYFSMKTKSKPEKFELHHQKDFDQFLFLYFPEKESKLHTLVRLASCCSSISQKRKSKQVLTS